MSAPAVERPHGPLGYRDGCRCSVCRYGRSEYLRAWREGRRIVPAGLVPIDAAREHINALSAKGLGYRRLAEITGVYVWTLRCWKEGKTLLGHRAAVEKVLAVPLESASAWLLDATGTARRVKALVALGWPMVDLAARIGWSSANLSRTTRKPLIEPKSAEKIAALYDELSMLLAPDSTPGRRARLRAVRYMWFPPLAWDDEKLDDPDALPCLLPPVGLCDPDVELAVQHVVAGHDVEISAEVRRELIRRTTDRPIKWTAKLARCSYDLVRRQRLEVAA